MTYLVLEDLKEHFTKMGMNQTVEELDKFNESTKKKDRISNRYFQQKIEFATKFEAFSYIQSCCDVTLYFECEDEDAEKLADNLGFDYYDCADGWEEREEEYAEIHVPRRWFDDIMHSWYEYQNRLDPEQMRLM